MRKYLVIYEEAVSHMILQPLPSGFPYILGKFIFIFYQCIVGDSLPKNLRSPPPSPAGP